MTKGQRYGGSQYVQNLYSSQSTDKENDLMTTKRRTIGSLAANIAERVELLERENGWNRDLGWSQVKNQTTIQMYEFGRFTMLVDLLEDLYDHVPKR